MKMRGPGDFFGIRQSGDMDFSIADIYLDYEILKQASDVIQMLNTKMIDITELEESILKEEIAGWIEQASNKINL